MITAVIIDDSAFMRKALSVMLESDPEIKIVGTARDGQEGYEIVKKLRPDVVTVDIEMPRTNGLECIEMIMGDVPTPILVVSSITTEGAEITLEALNKGAMDFIPKAQSFVAIDVTKIKEELLEKVRALTKRSRRQRLQAKGVTAKRHRQELMESHVPEIYDFSGKKFSAVVIGVSTGGPPVVQEILKSLPSNFPLPIMVAQHMPREFTGSFASRLDSISKIKVKEAASGDLVTRGTALIARGGKHLKLRREGIHVRAELADDPVDLLYHPSVDVLMESAASVYGKPILAIILTGMGKDGVEGLKFLKNKGGTILAQDEATCVVYGMPKAAVEAGLADAVLPVGDIVASLQTIKAQMM